DRHDKLSRFGFEVYVANDAYSHYIDWCYVGISNWTAVSINKQYLRTETVLLTESPTTLRRANKPHMPFHKAYSYGKSIKNQRIEAWWTLLTEGQTQE
ncbi:hypothetical protein HOY82DRAFT_479147, partial [Tuber indicum]